MTLVLIGILSVQFGAAVSKDQFGQIPPSGMVLLRLATSTLILLALARPRLPAGPRTVATLVVAPYAVVVSGSSLLEPRLLLLGALVGLLSSVIPYALEMIALRTMPARVFGILMSLEPGVAALVAAVLLSEWLTPLQLVAIACVTAASVGATRRSS